MKKYLLALAVLSSALSASATPPNQPILDGRPIDYDAADLRGTFTGGGGAFGAGVGITNLYVTWTTNYLYIALQGFESDNKLVVMLDVDPTNAVPTGATTTTNWSRQPPAYIGFNDVGWKKSEAGGATAFGLDYLVTTEGFYNNALRILYDGLAAPDTNNVQRLFDLADAGNGAVPLGTPVDMAAFTGATSNDLTGFEVRIPWSVVYGANTGRFGVVEAGEIVPRGTLLRLLANIHNNDSNSSFSANDAIPRQVSGNAAYAGGLLTSDNYIDVTVDGDGDGIPDIVGGGDVNAPFIRFLQGVSGTRQAYAQFNEALNESTATSIGNWILGNDTPASVVLTQTNAVLMQLTNDLPAAGAVVRVTATGVQDTSGNSKTTYNFLTAADSGLTTSVTVRFLLETASGLGASPGSTNFFINGGGLPLEFGFPPATSSPLSQFTGSIFYRDVTFPPGTPLTLNYKFSGILNATGTNTYEAVRLVNFADAARQLTLNTNGISMTITDYLGAAAAPYRNPATNTGYNALYLDSRRGDAGVRQRTTILFELDLRGYSLSGVTNVAIKGSDPLRGFNSESTGIADFNFGGLRMFDDASNGDTNSGDAIYAREWVFSTDGTDSTAEPGFPNSLVGGDFSVQPYTGTGWEDRRSPKSIVYKFYVHNNGAEMESLGGNIELYIQGSPTNIVCPLFAWNNPALPPPPPSNSPSVAVISPTGNNFRVLFTNQLTESQHGVQVSTNLLQGWLDYGLRASGAGGSWTATILGVGNKDEYYRTFAGPASPRQKVYWTPNPIPATGATVRFYYTQHQRLLAGYRDVKWFGSTNPFTGSNPYFFYPMTFASNGTWYVDFDLKGTNNGFYKFLFTLASPPPYDKNDAYGDDYKAQVGGAATWTPDPVAPGGILTVTYNASNRPLQGVTNLFANVFMDKWENGAVGGVQNVQMTNDLVDTNIWTFAITVGTNFTRTANFTFRQGSLFTFEDNNGGREWQAFIQVP